MEAEEIVGSFDEDELNEWKVGVQKGVREGDWTDLVARRTYQRNADSRSLRLIQEHCVQKPSPSFLRKRWGFPLKIVRRLTI